MADRVLTAEARITAVDQTGSVFQNIAKKIDGIGKASKISPQLDAMAKSLSMAERQMKALDAVQNQRGGFASARLKFAETQKAVEAAARAMRSAEAPTRQLTANHERAQRAVTQASAAFEKQRAAMVGAVRAAQEFGTPLGKIAAEQTRLKGVITSTTAAIEKQMIAERETDRLQDRRGSQAARRGRGGHGGDGTLASLAGLYVGHEVGHLAHNVIERYAEFDKERRYGQVVGGWSDAEQRPLIDQAIRGGATTRFNDIQWLESQRELAARGYNRDQVMGFTPVAAQLGQAFDVSMPDGVKALEGALLGFKKDTSTMQAAAASAQRTADLEVKASKISGMSYEDVVDAYKYAAAPAQMAHLSEEQMLAFAAIGKKANMPGSETGTAFRALAKNLLTPTAGAQIAMRAGGIDFNSYQKMPDRLDTGGFIAKVATNFGIQLDQKATAALGKIFTNKAIFGDATKFMPAIQTALGDTLGGDDAKSKNKIASLARSYRDASALGIDANGLMTAIMGAMSKNPGIANAIFGSKQGGRIYAAMGDPGFYAHILDELLHQSQGFAQKVSDARTEGFAGAVQRLQGSLANVETAIGRSLDRDGKGGALTLGTEGIGAALNAFVEAGPAVHQLAVAGAAAAGIWGGMKGLDLFKGGFGLQASATHLDESAMELKAAAAQIGGHGPGGAGVVPGGAGAGAPAGSPPMKSLLPRAFGYLGTSFPLMMGAFDDIVGGPDGRQERYDKQAETARDMRTWWSSKIRGARDFLHLGSVLRFSDDAPDMDPRKQGPRLPGKILEDDPWARVLRQAWGDPWSGKPAPGPPLDIRPPAQQAPYGPAFGPAFDPTKGGIGPFGPAAPAGPSSIGPVTAELTGQATVRIEINAPSGVVGGTSVIATGMIKPSVGGTMTHAANGGAGHYGRGDL